MNYLVSASQVAPAVVPDLVAIDTAQLSNLSQDIAVPLDGLVSPELATDLYSFAIQAGTVDEQLLALQFEVENVEHAIFNPSRIAVAPLSWTEVFSSGATYIFPAAGQGGLVNDAFLIQYLSTGAALVDLNGAPALDPETAVDVLTDTQLVAAAREEYLKRIGPDFEYVPLQGNIAPPLDYRNNP